MNKVVYVASCFLPVGENYTVKVATGEKKKGFFGGEKDVMIKETRFRQTGYSDSEIDGIKLSEDIANAVHVLNEEGYEVVSISPMTSGRYDYDFKYKEISGGGGSISMSMGNGNSHISNNSGGYGYGYGYGYSYTVGVVIVARKFNL